MITPRLETDGLGNVIARLDRLDPGLRREIQKQMKDAANPLISTARSLLPAASPLDNWGTWPRGSGPYTRQKASRGVKVTYKGRSDTKTIPLLTFRQTEAVGVIADMAGRANGAGRGSEGGNRGREMIGALNRRVGRRASRIMYPALEQNLPRVLMELQQAVDTTMDRFRKEIYWVG